MLSKVAEKTDRHSKPRDARPVASTPDAIARVEARNALLQFDRLREMIREAVSSGEPFRLRASDILELNRLAVLDLEPAAGTYRTVPVDIGGSRHEPPRWEQVPRHIENLCDYVNSHASESSIHLGSYVMWRLNWIHPFCDGNGRTTRAASYLVLCARLGYEIPGTKSVPEVIAGCKQPYYAALEQADEADLKGQVNVTAMEQVLADALAAQLNSVVDDARSGQRGARAPVTPVGIRSESHTPSAAHQTGWRGQPRWLRWLEVIGSGLVLVISAGFALLINWDNPRVALVRELLFSSEPASPPNTAPPAADEPASSRRSGTL